MSNLFSKLQIRGVTFPSRSEAKDGHPNDFHIINYGIYYSYYFKGKFALQGFGFIVQEATAVCPKGHLGIWDDSFIPEYKRIVDLVHKEGLIMGIQLGHAGRKGSQFPLTTTKGKRLFVLPDEENGWETEGPCAVPYNSSWPVPHELTTDEVKTIVKQFGEAAERSVKSGYDFIEVHAAHGFLIHEFLSPLTNHRTDEYGKDKTKILKDICVEIRKVIPKEMPLFVRFSCSDYADGGLTIDDILKISKELHDKYEVDLIDASSGGLVDNQKIPSNWDHQLPYAKAIHKLGIPSAAVGGICDGKLANDLIVNNEVDLVLIGRSVYRDAFLPRHVAQDLGLELPSYHESIRWSTRKPTHTKY